MKPLKLLTGGFAALLDWTNGGRRVIPYRRRSVAPSLTWGEVRRAAVALHGPGTKVRIWSDGSGHLLPPPPYREEERRYVFDNEFHLRRLLPSLGAITMEEWKSGKCPVEHPASKGSLDLSSAHDIVASWPKWKQDLAKQILRPSKPPASKEDLAKLMRQDR